MNSIAVVIPSFNRLALLQRALDSVLAQTVSVAEIIVVDDGSSDGTTAILQPSYPQVRFLLQENRGVSVARNAGIAAAGGDWIALLDSDDVWHPDKIARQMQAIAAAPDYLICHSNEVWIRRGVRVNPMRKHTKTGGRIFQQCLPRCVISPSTVMLNRVMFDELGYFDESLPACEDYDLWLRFCARYPVLYVEEALVTKYGGHEDQLSRRYWGMDRFRIQALHNIISTDKLADDDRHAAIKVMLDKITIYLIGAAKRNNTQYVNKFERLLSEYAAAGVES